MHQTLLQRVVLWGRKHPKHRKIAVAFLAIIIFTKLLTKFIRAFLKYYVPRAAVALAVLGLCVMIPMSSVISADESMNIEDGQVALAAGTESGDLGIDQQVAETIEENLQVLEGDKLTELPDPVEPEVLPWNLALFNGDNPVPDDYTYEQVAIRNGYMVDARIYDDLKNMLDDCNKLGYNVFVCSAYRSEERQTELFEASYKTAVKKGYTEEEAYEIAASQYSEPGCSEHQVGLSVDIVPVKQQLLNEALGDNPAEQWLTAHCAEYGFILRYPENQEDITGITYEPWHYRYVGVEAATYIMEHGITLEEYLEEFYAGYVNAE